MNYRVRPSMRTRREAIAAAIDNGYLRAVGDLLDRLERYAREAEAIDDRPVTRAEIAKDAETRILPISVPLAAVLEMAVLDLAGHPLVSDGFVFGDGTGRRVTSIKRAWTTATLKAHQHQPQWTAGGKLAPTSRAQLRRIDLHFHDLRHEAGSRLIEGGWPVHQVQEMLGHGSLEQTTTYLNVTKDGLRESMRKLDEARARCKSVANPAAIVPAARPSPSPAPPANPLVN